MPQRNILAELLYYTMVFANKIGIVKALRTWIDSVEGSIDQVMAAYDIIRRIHTTGPITIDYVADDEIGIILLVPEWTHKFSRGWTSVTNPSPAIIAAAHEVWRKHRPIPTVTVKKEEQFRHKRERLEVQIRDLRVNAGVNSIMQSELRVSPFDGQLYVDTFYSLCCNGSCLPCSVRVWEDGRVEHNTPGGAVQPFLAID